MCKVTKLSDRHDPLKAALEEINEFRRFSEMPIEAMCQHARKLADLRRGGGRVVPFRRR